MAVLRAFQKWAVESNINIALADDNGEALGTSGAVQNDPRFGDIRIAATSLPGKSLAIATPFSNNAGTWSGDVVLNSDADFGLGTNGAYNLFSVLLHEAGHVLGVAESTDPNSPMFQSYNGRRSGLTAQDIARITSVHGVRQADSFDRQAPNGTFASATAIFHQISDGESLGSIRGDVTTTADVDFYRFTVPLGAQSVGLRLKTSDISLFVGRLTLYNSQGVAIESLAAEDPF
jgi:hypothetical protein